MNILQSEACDELKRAHELTLWLHVLWPRVVYEVKCSCGVFSGFIDQKGPIKKRNKGNSWQEPLEYLQVEY